MLAELRAACRGLLHAPAVAAVAVLTLGLGVGANTAIFSLVDAVLLRPLPYPEASRLLSVRERDRQFPSMSVSYPDYLDWLAGNHSFSGLGIYRGTAAVLTHLGPPVLLPGQEASAPFFSVLGVPPERGRTFLPAEDRPGAPAVVVISDSFWRNRLGADPRVLGRSLELDAKPRTIVGVMPPNFPGIVTGENAPQYWVPIGAEATAESGLMHRGAHPGLNGVGRLKPGVSEVMARADLERIAAALASEYPKSNTGESVVVRPYLDWLVRNSNPSALWLLLGAVSLVLLIACANVANLLLARAAGRHKVFAIRAALGASRARLIREHFCESLWLGLGGSLLGLALAQAGMRAAPALLPAGMARAGQLGLDARVLGFTLALTLLTTVLFGVAPALHAGRVNLADTLKQGGRESAGGGGRLRAALVALEMALALMLLLGAGLLIRSLIRLQQVDPGFNPHGLLTFEVALPAARYPTAAQSLEFYRQAEQRLRQLPGVTAVGGISPLPFSGNDWENGFYITGRPAPAPGSEPSTNYAMVSGDYLQAAGMRLLRGRAFTDADSAHVPLVAMIDDSFARRYWTGPDPFAAALGQQIHMGSHDLSVVGVFARVKDYGLDSRDTLPELFVPLAQADNQTDTDLVVRTAQADPLQLRGPVTAAIQSLDPDQPINDMATMEQRISLSLAQRRLTLVLMAAFALLALALAAIGIYGVLSYAVAQRAHEIGVRMALGANRGRVLRLVLAQGLRLAGIGTVAGLAAALALGRLASSFLYGVSWRDPLTLCAVPVLLLAIAALACYLPARRATQVDPLLALRGE